MAFALGLAALFAFLPAPAHALSVPLTFEFDDGVEGDYGTVTVVEDGSDGLFFEIALGPALGSDADLHFFYFNLPSDLSLAITSGDSVETEYALGDGSPVRGGAGSSFEFSVFFGHGAGPKGNGDLDVATFTLFSTDPEVQLSLDLFELSSTSQGLESHFAAHVQSTSTGGGSETVGAVIPEPTPFALVALGLLGLTVAGRRSA